MGQYMKDEIRQRIIDTAREEFMEKGFEKASIRTITSKAKTSKSNIYNYFKDKNDLFNQVLEPTIQKIRFGLESAKQFNQPKGVSEYTLDSQAYVIKIIFQFIAENITDIRLLLFKAHGSTLEGFKYGLLNAFTDNMYAWVNSIRSDKEISRDFVMCICSCYLTQIELLLLHGNSDDVRGLPKEFAAFIYHGWKGILE